MIKTLLKYDYCTAEWFASSHDRVLPGVSFIFLGKLSWIFLSLYCIALHYIPYKFSIEVLVIGVMAGMFLIVYSLQKTIWRLVRKYDLRKEYKYLSKSEKRKRNFVVLASCILVYGGSFYIAVKMIGGYAVN